MRAILVTLLTVSSLLSAPGLHIRIKDRVFNDLYRPYISCQCPLQIFYGGASSGKSVFAAQRRIISMVREPRNYLVVRNVANTIRSSVFTETERAISAFQLNSYFTVIHSTMEIIYNVDGRRILFRGLDDVEKIKSIVVPIGTLTDIEIEEATEVSEDNYDKLGLRMRGLSVVPKRKHLYFNPTFRTHWIARRFFNGQLIKYKYDGNILIVHSTHKDNKFLTQEDHDEIEAKTGYVHDVYADGKWGVLGDLVFNNWSVEECKGIEFDVTRYGLDFGFTNDPSAVVKVGISKAKKTLYVQQEIYKHGVTNDVLAQMAKPIVTNNIVWCDCAEPKSISELRNQGANSLSAMPVKKDKIWQALQWLNQWKIVVDPSCKNFINEISQYQWIKNKDGISLNEPVDINNHLMDAFRYATERDRYGTGISMVV